jgi:hypothetical protein
MILGTLISWFIGEIFSIVLFFACVKAGTSFAKNIRRFYVKNGFTEFNKRMIQVNGKSIENWSFQITI